MKKILCLLLPLLCGINAAELPGQWKVVPADAMKVVSTPDRITQVTLLKQPRLQGSLEQTVTGLTPNVNYIAAAKVKSSIAGMAYLQVKTYRSGKNLRRFDSKPSTVKEQILQCEFQMPEDADKITVQVRIVNDADKVGQEVSFGPVILEPVTDVTSTPGRLTIIPTYENCSYYFNLEKGEEPLPLTMEYRRQGTQKFIPVEPVYMPDERQYRGSLVELEENSNYELKLTHGTTTISREFTTLNSQVPVEKTVWLDPANFNGLQITESGRPDAWIKYTAKPGAVFTADTQNTAVLHLLNVRYVILENLTLRGGERYGVWLDNCENIQILNCDIAGFGRVGEQGFDRDGKYYLDGKSINLDPGINIFKSGKVLVERCFIHDPRAQANSWFYSHPAGPQAVLVQGTGGVVLRYNDFIGGDKHRWNDGVEGIMNSAEYGGFCRDADIYGNMFALGNDDGIELDGGQMNIRVYRNRFEHFLCGISTGPCLLGPSYIFRNLILNLGEENGGGLYAFKNSHRRWGKGRLFFNNNTVSTPQGTGFGGYSSTNPDPVYAKELKAIIEKNVFQTGNGTIAGLGFLTKRRTLSNHNQHECLNPDDKVKENFASFQQESDGIFEAIPFIDAPNGDYRLRPGSEAAKRGLGAFIADEPLPFRPIPVTVTPQKLHFKAGTQEQKLTVTVTGENFNSVYKMCQTTEADWLSITPPSGTLKSGDTFTVTVKVDPDKLPAKRRTDTVILLRLDNGFSRPVSINADWHDGQTTLPSQAIELPIMNFSNADKFPKGAENEIYLSPSVQEQLSYEFTVKEAGEYYLFALVRCPVPSSGHNSFKLSMDGDEMLTAKFTFNASPNQRYVGVSRNIEGGRAKHSYERHKLSAGKHRIVIEPRQGQYISKLLFAPTPEQILQ